MEGIDNWKELTWQEKRKQRFERWLEAPGVEFKDAAAKERYRKRVQRYQDVINLKEPDRVPVNLPTGYFPAYHAGYDLKTVMYDYEKQRDAWLKFMYDFGDMDAYSGPGLVLPAPMFDIIGHKMHTWPGHGTPDDTPNYQFIEGEYMLPHEYDKLINDPSDFWLRTFMPRQAKAFEPLADFMHLNPMIGLPFGTITSLSTPAMRQMMQTIWKAGDEVEKWMRITGEVGKTALSLGYPGMAGGMSGAPFDMLTDMLRGTIGIFMDMFRQPDKIHEAMDRITPIVIEQAVASAEHSLSPVVMMPLHKGEKGFMSPKQFETFYWPSFKKVLLGIIEEGLVPMPFAEGNYIPRLDIIKDMPRASMVWYFEYMDMAQAKATVGRDNCICGNLPISVMVTGSAAQVTEGCRNLIETCAPGGGYILSASASMEKGNMENLHAMFDAAKQYGVYK